MAKKAKGKKDKRDRFILTVYVDDAPVVQASESLLLYHAKFSPGEVFPILAGERTVYLTLERNT